jgi:CheY-like chemotaxis protein
LRNFISNALKFTECGEIRVSARLAPAGDTVVLAVADTGIGIAPDDQEAIFEAFTQLENALQRRVKGTGLGLPLCRKLAMLLGGHIEVDSQVDVGSTFSVVLPMRSQRPNDYDEMTPEVWQPQLLQPVILVVEEDDGTLFLYDKYLPWLLETVRQFIHQESLETLLIVDDDPASRYVLARCLGSTSYDIREAASGLDGLLKSRTDRPRAVFLDLHLPDMSGFEVLDRLQTDPCTQDIPVILYTAQPLNAEMRRQLAAREVVLLEKNALTDDEVLACLASLPRVKP